MDFGIARAVSDCSSTVAETTAILGTAAYFSPEQAKGEPVDARADLYSAGVVLYELLAGRPPFRGESPVAVAYQHVSEAPLPPSEVNETVPRSLDAVALRALAKDPFQRYQDAAAFREALDATVDGRSPSKRAGRRAHERAVRPEPAAGRRDGAVAAPAEHRHDDEAHPGRARRSPGSGRASRSSPCCSSRCSSGCSRSGRAARCPRTARHRPRCHRHDLRARQRRARRRRTSSRSASTSRTPRSRSATSSAPIPRRARR